MLRWNEVEEQTVFDMTVKMYREPVVADETFVSPLKGLELDHYAYRYYDSEIYMYRILDVNFIRYIEERGDLDRVGDIDIMARVDIMTKVL
jgi:hypothetical protein